MSVQVLCPSCGSVSEIHRPPVRECVRCHADLPDALQRSVNRALAETRAPKPVLLTVGQWFSLAAGLSFVVVVLLAPFDIGTYSINDEVVPGPEFLRRGGWFLAAVGGLLLTIGIGLWLERDWSRPLMVGYWLALAMLVVLTSQTGGGDLVGGCLVCLVSGAVAAWYLYRKPGVRAYFEARMPPTATTRDV